MKLANFAIVAVVGLLAGCAATGRHADGSDSKQQVWATEQAFARSMADRDHRAFVSFLSEEAVFFTAQGVLRGKQQVAEAWQRFYQGPLAPFAWEAGEVEVLDSGTLALSSGPVRSRDGNVIGTFTSIWRLEGPGTWRIVFDKGCNACPKPNAGER